MAQPFGHCFGGLQFALAVQFDAPLRAGEQLASGSAGVVGPDCDAQLGDVGVALCATGAQVRPGEATPAGDERNGSSESGETSEAPEEWAGAGDDVVSVRAAVSAATGPHR